MVLIDSSCWGHYFRQRGDAQIRERVTQLLEGGEAAWCAPIRLELWNGVGSESDRKMLRDHELWLPELPILEGVWSNAYSLANQCRKNGRTAPAIDLLIAACARHYEVKLEFADAHFDFLLRL